MNKFLRLLSVATVLVIGFGAQVNPRRGMTSGQRQANPDTPMTLVNNHTVDIKVYVDVYKGGPQPTKFTLQIPSKGSAQIDARSSQPVSIQSVTDLAGQNRGFAQNQNGGTIYIEQR